MISEVIIRLYFFMLLSFPRRVASKSKRSDEAGPSCSPFGKKKKCKDKYLAKHSSSKYHINLL